MKWFKAFIAATLILFIFCYFYVQKTVLPLNGKIKLTGLSSEVNLYQDQYGVAHIEAKNGTDAYRALGYFFASQRLFQMEMLKRIVRGQLSELFGPDFIEADQLLRTLGFYRKAKQTLEKLAPKTTPEALIQINAFLEGVNYFVKNETTPIEFLLLGTNPTEFDINDIMGVGGYMALTFAEAMVSDLNFFILNKQLDQQQLKTLMSRDEIDWKVYSEKIALPSLIKIEKTVESISKVAPLFYGSNSWVVSGKRSMSGYPLLANDPHIAYSNPAVFIEAHIKYEDFEIYGNFIPLVPFAILGHTPKTAWAITMSETDDMDFYIEKINPQNPNQVMYKNEWVDLVRTKETIKVKGEGSIELEVLESPHGPLINQTKYGIEKANLSLKWAALSLDNNNFETFYQLPRAKTVEEFKNALSHSTSPGLNFSWINQAGDIAWWVMNQIPKRPQGFIHDMPMPGWNGQYEYLGYLSIDENPHLVNPEEGIIVTANYKPQVKKFQHIPGYWQPAGRYFRIKSLLEQKEKWTVDEFKKIQLDSVVPKGSNFKDIYVENIDPTKLSASQIKAYDFLKKWDGSSDMQNVASSIYHMTTGHLVQDIFRDELKDRYDSFSKGSDFWASFKTVMADLNNSFWDNLNTEQIETASDIITGAFIKATKELERRLGQNVAAWQWGKIHLVEFVHPFGKKKPLDLIFNIGPYPVDGGRYQINNIAFDKSGTNFTALHGPAVRRLIDMANPRVSEAVIPTGNSGNIFDKNFNDQTQLYIQGKYRAQIMQWDEIKQMPRIIFY